MPVLVTCKFDMDPIKNECAIVSITFSLLVYKSMGTIFNAQGHVTQKLIDGCGPNSNSKDFMTSSWMKIR